MTELDDLRVKLSARKGKPGFTVNAMMLEARIAVLEGNAFTFRDIPTGVFVSNDYAAANPDTTRKVEQV